MPPPIDHPMWGTQVELERGMMREGADNFRDRVATAVERKQMTRLNPIRRLVTDFIPPIADSITAWTKAWGGHKGSTPVALPYLKSLDAHVLAYIGLKGCLDGLTAGRNPVTSLACELGRTVEHEAQVRAWEKLEPALFHAQQKKLEDQEATDAHIRRVNINRFNALMSAGLFGFEWEKWPQEVHFRVGIELINAIVRVTDWFEFRADPEFHFKKGSQHKPATLLVPKQFMVDWLGEQIDREEWTSPAFQPTVVPPARWEGTRRGGYYTPYIKTPRLIRFKVNQQSQRDRAADEYEALDMPKVYEAVHYLQEVPWRVNRRILSIAEEAVARDLGLGHLPLAEERKLPPFPPGYLQDDPEAREARALRRALRQETGTPSMLPEDGVKVDRWVNVSEEDKRTWRKAAAQVYAHNARNVSNVRSSRRTYKIAYKFRDFERFYFPHMLDFRGRAYPIPVGLQPQGDDLARGLLQFAEGRAIEDEEAAGWLAIQVASMWGWDKLPNEERIDKVFENEALWRRIVADPIGNEEWYAKGVDKPWQALSAIIDWVAFLDYGYGYVSHAVVSVDGTCNGIQHLSAITRDQEAGEHVNLVPGDRPKDIYKHVARKLQETIERIEEAGGHPASLATYWLDLCNRDLPRGLTKRQVMVLPYGGTKDSYITYTREWLDEADPEGPEAGKAESDLRFERILFLVGHMWDAVNSSVSGGMKVMTWLKECAKVASVGNQPIFWTTPSGFVVRHFYGKQKVKQVECKLDGSRAQLTLPWTTKDLDIKAQLLGISPNFVHSQDAAALVLCIVRAKADGIGAFTSVHDAFGTHAASMGRLSGHLRAAFVEVHSVDALDTFRGACLSVMVSQIVVSENVDPLEAFERADEKLPRVPPKGHLDLVKVLDSPYFFA